MDERDDPGLHYNDYEGTGSDLPDDPYYPEERWMSRTKNYSSGLYFLNKSGKPPGTGILRKTEKSFSLRMDGVRTVMRVRQCLQETTRVSRK